MAFGFLRNRSIITHRWLGWWWGRRHGYPREEQGIEVALYGWVEVDVATSTAVASPVAGNGAAARAGSESSTLTGTAFASEGLSVATVTSGNITTLPIRA